MYLSVLTFIFALIGIAATFLPWVHYPKGNADLYGYVGDGIVTGFVFLVVSILSGLELLRHKHKVAIKIVNTILGLLMLIAGISKITEIENEKTNFETDNPFIGAAFAGFTQGVGLYVLLLAGAGVLIFSFSGLYLALKKNSVAHTDKKWYIVVPLVLIALLGSIIFINRSGINFSGTPSAETMELTIKNDIENMGQCLINRDFDCFIDYNHPMIVQSYGTKQKMKEIINQALRTYKDQKGEYKKIVFVNIQQTEKEGNNIQSIINQDVTIDTPDGDIKEQQQVLAVSEDNGITWHYINLSGTDKEKLSRFYPEINKNLKF